MLAPLWAQAPAATEVLRARSAACGMMGVSVKVTFYTCQKTTLLLLCYLL